MIVYIPCVQLYAMCYVYTCQVLCLSLYMRCAVEERGLKWRNSYPSNKERFRLGTSELPRSFEVGSVDYCSFVPCRGYLSLRFVTCSRLCKKVAKHLSDIQRHAYTFSGSGRKISAVLGGVFQQSQGNLPSLMYPVKALTYLQKYQIILNQT